MMITGKSQSMRDLQVEGRGLRTSSDDANDMSPSRKKTKRGLGRSKSLVDTTSKKTRVNEGINNQGFYYTGDNGRHQPYLRRMPTQDDIYKILDETSDIIRPATTDGESKRLSPYIPLPAIGSKYKSAPNKNANISAAKGNVDNAKSLQKMGEGNSTTNKMLEDKSTKPKPVLSNATKKPKNSHVKFHQNLISEHGENNINGGKSNQNASKNTHSLQTLDQTSEIADISKIKSRTSNEITANTQATAMEVDSANLNDESAPKLVREGTYNVLEPKFVKGPVDTSETTPRRTINRNSNGKKKKKQVDPLKESSTTIVFGPRLANEQDIFEEDLTAVDSPSHTQNGVPQPSSTSTNSGSQQGNGIPTTRENTIVVQKLYYRTAENTTNNGNQLLESDLSNINIADTTNKKRASDLPQVHPAFWFDF
ncbi:hypothetical protein C0J52_17842 [Blattella germanica]|nr:hypothetical protein C0J52_17842 [Blattella germanica]